mgnify:CR=1 FL=1
MRYKNPILKSLLSIFAVVAFAATAWGQAGSASVSGAVADAQGNVVAGASVTLSDAARGFSRSVTTAASGTFTFPAVAPGLYKIEVQANNFKKYVQSNVKVVVDTPLTVSVGLEVGGVTETVTVDSNTAESLVNNQDATVGNTFVSQQVTQLPTEARNVLSLLTLQPGVTQDGYVAGSRSDQSNITLDGVDINEAQTNAIETPVLRLNSEAIEEFRVTTTTANASSGRSSGAQVSLITKSGTNQFRGAAFITGRDTSWSANNFFNNRSGVAREKYDKFLYGGAIGGPIVKDKAFFFYSLESERTTRGASQLQVVPLPSMGQGLIKYVNTSGTVSQLTCAQIGAIYPAAVGTGTTGGCNTAVLPVLAGAASRYAYNNFDVGDSIAGRLANTAGYRFNSDSKIRNTSHVGRLDFNLNSKQSVFVRANVIYDTATSASAFPDTAKPGTWSHPWGFVAGHTWTISNNLVNNFRYGLTREAFSSQGDSGENAVYFRFIYTPKLFARTLSRTTPVQNITNDLSYIRGSHTLQFGTNIRFIKNYRASYSSSFDTALTNPSFYSSSVFGTATSGPVANYITANSLSPISSATFANFQNAAAALIGRYTQYTANFLFLKSGSIQASGTPSERTFRTNEYDFYTQDVWKVSSNLTLTLGLRYSYSKPVWETNGYEVKPTEGLGAYFAKRAAGYQSGTPYNAPIVLNLSGQANGKTPLYTPDKNNWQPRIAAAWSPDFGDNLFGNFVGREGKGVIRGGFGMFNDYYGQALAVRFDLNNALGFASSSTVNANTYNLTTNLGPLFTGLGQTVRTLPNITIPSAISFPRQAANRSYPTAIQGGLDENITAPIHYTWSLTWERNLPKGFVVSASYLGREARNLLQSRDIAAVGSYRDPVSKMDWWTAATQLEILAQRGVAATSVATIPYFDNVWTPGYLASYYGFPGYTNTQAVYAARLFYYGNDWTSHQLDLSIENRLFPGQHIFYQPQYGTYGAFSSVGKSNYHGGTLTIRQRMGKALTWDFNYTLSKTMDQGSGLQSGGVTSGAGFFLNPFRPDDMWAVSDFDSKHIINANAIWQLPIGRGQMLGRNIGKLADAFIGGWQLTGIFRANTGNPESAPYDDARWATNWNVQSYTTRTSSTIKPCPTRGGKYFGCNTTAAYQSFRNAYPGETGDRNVFRQPGYWGVDMGFGKTVAMPYNEDHKLQFRWEVFNVTNTQHMGLIDYSRTGYGLGLDPKLTNSTPPTNWSNFVGIQGSPRSMQYVIRYSF